jgi:putative protein-disulfide isomerase
VTYLFDPLCGWCYGAAPVIARLAEEGEIPVTPLPVGLFAGDGARPMEAKLAEYFWANDQRIAELSGQRFTEAYRTKVLQAKDSWFDSAAATLALTAVSLSEPARELAALELIQKTRYIDGGDVIAPRSLMELLEANGFAAASRIARADAELIDANRARIARGRELMAALGAEGVPALVVAGDHGEHALDAGILFNGFDALKRALAAA